MAGPTVVSMGEVCVRGSVREVCTGALVSWLPLGSCKLGFMISSEVPGLPVTETALELEVCKVVKKRFLLVLILLPPFLQISWTHPLLL